LFGNLAGRQGLRESEALAFHDLIIGSATIIEVKLSLFEMKVLKVKRGDRGPLIKKYGITLEEAGKQLGLTVSAVSKMMSREDSGLSS
jgi:hypothetical protein